MKNCSPKLTLKEKWRRSALPGSLWRKYEQDVLSQAYSQRKNEEELLCQAPYKSKMKDDTSPKLLWRTNGEGMKKNSSPKLSMKGKWRRIALPGTPKSNSSTCFLSRDLHTAILLHFSLGSAQTVIIPHFAFKRRLHKDITLHLSFRKDPKWKLILDLTCLLFFGLGVMETPVGPSLQKCPWISPKITLEYLQNNTLRAL